MSEDTICDKATKIIDENKRFTFCYKPKTDAVGEIICNGSCVGEISANNECSKIYVCNDLSKVHFKEYYKKN